MTTILKQLSVLRLPAVLAVSALLLVTACSEFNDEPASPQQEQQGVVLSKDNPGIRRAMAAQERHTMLLMDNPAVVGTAVTATEDGQPAIMIMLKHDMPAQAFPKTIEGYPVVLEVTGVIRAMKGKPGGKPGGTTVDHRAKQIPPIELGTSGGWGYDLANGYCCGGTLGSLIQNNDGMFVLSNYHVLNADIVSGGNNRVASIGDPVIQPGLIDVSCNMANAQAVATLADAGSNATLPNSNIDAAIAQILPGMVKTTGEILEIGQIKAGTGVAASIGMEVKKSGRTTGLTRSSISGLNAIVSIAYDNECAGGAAFTKTYTGQIVIKNKASKFLNSGDSGSLMVEDLTTSPRAVGLLYAGSSVTAIANPISDVLNHYGASMVGAP